MEIPLYYALFIITEVICPYHHIFYVVPYRTNEKRPAETERLVFPY